VLYFDRDRKTEIETKDPLNPGGENFKLHLKQNPMMTEDILLRGELTSPR
jgi:hypothetical protein